MAVALSTYAPVIDSQGASVNPTTATVLCDTGALTGGIYSAIVIATSTVDTQFAMQHRDAANAANVDDVQVFTVLAGASIALPFRFAVNPNERLRVLPNANPAASTANVSITAWRIA